MCIPFGYFYAERSMYEMYALKLNPDNYDHNEKTISNILRAADRDGV